ncbi:MAG: hypothetical protein KME42_06125 [Tildeniella nuda ZEHNDER 1965/U140]|jgi:hypothetical protein|nr:hypothetical protein [Tildeniella nuda ZEHNDER 1965/U140]
MKILTGTIAEISNDVTMQMKETTIETLEEHLRQAMLNSDISTLDELIVDCHFLLLGGVRAHFGQCASVCA